VNGCASGQPRIRRAGQVELFEIHNDGRISPAMSMSDDSPVRNVRTTVAGAFGEPIRYNDDVITLQVHAAHLADLPRGLTGSTDIILFAEVWENAALGYNAPSLNSIVYVAQDQIVPGKLSFMGNLAYGPTNFKGHPLKVRFTLMVLQKRLGEQQSSVAEIVQNFASAASAATPYARIASEAVSVLRAILRSQPDIIAFDFEATLLADEPEGLVEAIQIGSDAPLPSPLTLASPFVPADTRGLDEQMPWLCYGAYALVETCSRSERRDDAGSNPLPHTWYEDASATIGDVIWNGSGDPERLQHNWLTFSFTPKQIAQRAEHLRAASTATDGLVAAISRREGSITDVLDAVDTASAVLRLQLVTQRLQHAARDTATFVQRTHPPHNWSTQFQKVFKERTQLTIDNDWSHDEELQRELHRLTSALALQWRRRLTEMAANCP
jgi:hypothetical protein